MVNNESLQCCADEACTGTQNDPDCIRCLRKKISADGVVVFFRSSSGWRIGNCESDIPLAAAEAHFNFMLRSGLPAIVVAKKGGILLNTLEEVKSELVVLEKFFSDKCVIGAAVKVGQHDGVRIAWREALAPFTSEDLVTLQCFSKCPDNCEPSRTQP